MIFCDVWPIKCWVGIQKSGKKKKKKKKKGSMVGHIAVYTILGNCQALDGPNNLSTSFSHLWLGQWALLVPTLGGQSPFPHLISYPNALIIILLEWLVKAILVIKVEVINFMSWWNTIFFSFFLGKQGSSLQECLVYRNTEGKWIFYLYFYFIMNENKFGDFIYSIWMNLQIQYQNDYLFIF